MTHSLLRPVVRFALAATTVLLLLTGAARAQDSSTGPKDGYTPSGLEPGRPSGSYDLSGFENINPYNGRLNFSLPLMHVGGRGAAGFTMNLPIHQTWSRRRTITELPDYGYLDVTDYLYNDNDWTPYLGPGRMILRQPGDGPVQCPNDGGYVYYNTYSRFTFVDAQGTEHELVDETYKGKPLHFPYSCSAVHGLSRGHVFTSTDGGSMTFVSDDEIFDDYFMDNDTADATGTLYFADGTRYRVESSMVVWVADRNGNRVTPTADSLGRAFPLQHDSAAMTDTLIIPGFGGTTHAIAVRWGYLHDALRPANAQHPAESLTNIGSYTPFDPYIVRGVTLPNGMSYSFYYDGYGELSRVVLPTGGAVEYDWAQEGDIEARRVAVRRVYADGNTLTSKTVYGQPSVQETPTAWSDHYTYETTATVDYYDAADNRLYGERHYYYGSAIHSIWRAENEPLSFPHWNEGKEYKTEVYDGSGNLLRVTTQNWAQASVSWWPAWAAQNNLDPNAGPPNDPHVTEVATTLSDTGQVTRQTYAYDQFNNRTDVWEYDYDKPNPSRHTHTDYLTTNPVNGIDYTSTPVHVRNLPRAEQVYSVNPDTGAEALAAQSETRYDETALSPWYGAVQSWVDPGASRGNPTKVRRWNNVTGAWVEARAEFDQCGSVSKSYDANNNMTETVYSATYKYAYPTQVTSPVPDPSGQYGSASALVTTVAYDFSTGLAISVTSPNNQTTSYFYADDFGNPDPLDRLRKVVRPGGTQAGGGGQTVYSYGDAPGNLYVRAQTSLDPVRTTDSFQYFDRMGRAVRSQQYENADASKPWLTVDTEYDALGRVRRVSRPYRWAAGTGSPFSTDRWTETEYDALGRTRVVRTKPDNAVVAIDYSGDRVLVKDQASRERVSRTDALGRLTDVWEVTPAESGPNASTVSLAFPGHTEAAAGYLTTYKYDALGNLRMVQQSGQRGGQQFTQQRFFMYDSLGRLLRVKLPEQGNYAPDQSEFPALTDPVTNNSQWSAAYSYDAAGNLTSRKDARGVRVEYSYDALNRDKTVTYTIPAGGVAPTQNVAHYYDAATNGKGRLYRTEAAGTAQTTFLAYDAAGRPTQYQQKFWSGGVWGQAYSVQRAYNLGGGVTSETYPSGRSVSYNYDIAGRPGDDNGQAAFSGNLGDGAARAYSSEVRYQEMGGMEQERFGTDTPVYDKHLFNNRGQLSEIRVSTYSLYTPGQETNWNRGALINHYSDQSWAGSGTDNDGNLKKQDIYIPDDDQIMGYGLSTFFYDYDALNRLYQEREVRGGANQWAQYFVYDRWGNRTVNAGGTWGGAPEPQYSVDAATNRIGAPSGSGGAIGYDAAGNQTLDTYQGGLGGGGSRSFDAENRMASAQFVSGQAQTASYAYDADGRRIKRNVGTASEVWQVYGMDGELLAEYAAGASPSTPQREYGYRGGELLVTAEAAAAQPQRVNYAAASNGGTASAQNFTQDGYYPGYDFHFQPAYANDGVRFITPAGDHYWRDHNGLASWVQIDFSGAKSIDEVDVFTLADYPAYQTQADPSSTQTFTQFGATAFDVQYWDGFAWQTVPGGSITGNNLIWKKVNFTAVTTTKIRVVVNAAVDGVARLAEVEAWGGGSATTSGGGGVRWLVSDQLGTPRMVLDQSGSLSNVSRHDYYPFGEEVAGDPNWRTTARGYRGDTVRQQFAGYERDSATGLDYARARYFSPAQGRFNGVDPLVASARAASPQTWNRYSYALNNPLRYSDPSGLSVTMPSAGGTAEDKHNEEMQQRPPTPQQPLAPAIPPPAAGSPPVDSSLVGSPAYVEQHPIVTGIQAYVPPPRFVLNDYFDGACHIGVISYAQFTPVTEDGVPVDEPVTYREIVVPASSVQNPNDETAPDGTIPDRIGRAGVGPCRPTQWQIDNQKGYMATIPFPPDTGTQTLLIATPGRGVVLTFVNDRTTTYRPYVAVDSRGIPVPNYAVTVNTISLTTSIVGRR